MERRFAAAPPPATTGNPNFGNPPQGQYWYSPPPPPAIDSQFNPPQNFQNFQNFQSSSQFRPPPLNFPPPYHLQRFPQPSPYFPQPNQSFGPTMPPQPQAYSLQNQSFPPMMQSHSPAYPQPNQSFPPTVPPQPPAYSQPNQMWENSQWHGAQGWNNADNFQYDNGEDWASRARAWAVSDPAVQGPPVQAHFSSFDAPNTHYNQNYHHDGQLSTVSAPEEHIPDTERDTSRKLNNMHDGAILAERSVVIGPPQQSFTSSTFINMPEVSSSYSSSSGNKEAKDVLERSLMPMPSNPLPRDHFVEASGLVGQNQAFEPFPIDQGQVQTAFPIINTELTDPIKQGTSSPSVFGYAQAAGPVPVPLFPSVSPIPPGPQFELSPQVFGRVQPPNFQPPFHPAAAFPADTVEAYNLSERPKKTAVPNWLRDEIIKKKATPVGPTQEHPSDNSHPVPTHARKKDAQNEEPINGKGIGSPKSSEDEDEDEDDVDETRLAAINLEIKRVLTDVLLKVTDELFEEIATNILDEDESEEVLVSNHGKHSDAITSPPSSRPKIPAKVILPPAPVLRNSDEATHLKNSNTGGAILGLADYSSDDEDVSEEIQESNSSIPPNIHETRDRRLEREVGPISSKEHIEASQELDSQGKGVHALSNGSRINQDKTKVGFVDQRKAVESPEKRNDSTVKDLVRERPLVESSKGKSSVKEVESTSLKSNWGNSLYGVHQSSVSKQGSKDNLDPGKDAKTLESKTDSMMKDLVREKPLVESNKGKTTGKEVESTSLKSNRVNSSSEVPSVKTSRENTQERVHQSSVFKRGSKDNVDSEKAVESPENRNNSMKKDPVREKPLLESNKGKPIGEEVISSSKSNRGDSLTGVPSKKAAHDNISETTHQSSVTKRGSKDGVDDGKISTMDKRSRTRDDGADGRKREVVKDEREDRSRVSEKDLRKQKLGHNSPPSAKSRVSAKEGSMNSTGETDHVIESSRKRKLDARKPSLSPSPSRPRRQVLRSPHSRHSQRRHSPYSHPDSRRRSRSRSISPGQRRRSGHRR